MDTNTSNTSKSSGNSRLLDDLQSLLIANRNLIFTGAPGTGKTYLAKQLAAKMIGCKMEEFAQNVQFCFVQFHPSYDYTDFVEGLRPTPPDKNGNVGFELKDGVFKDFCIQAETARQSSNTQKTNSTNQGLARGILTPHQAQQALDEFNNVVLRNNNTLSLVSIGRHTSFTIKVNTNNKIEVCPESTGNWSEINNKPIIDYIADAKHNYKIRNDTYEPAIGQYILNTMKPYVFVIDEINRGEMSKIFGELFFSIDPGYRGVKGAVKTQYANMQTGPNVFDNALYPKTDVKTSTNIWGHFFVPENVYIIGTMNDIDRSVESMDFAMRRRFAWKEVTAEDSMDMLNAFSQTIIDSLKNRMRNLNDAILGKYVPKNDNVNYDSGVAKTLGLGLEYQIGAAYFLKFGEYYENDESKAFKMLWDNHIKILLSEYLRGNSNADDQLEYLKEAYDDDKKHNNNAEQTIDNTYDKDALQLSN